MPAWLSASEQVGFARSYEAQVDEVFRRNPVGQRAVRLVSGMLRALPVYAVEGDDRAAEIVGSDGLLEGIAAQLLLHGNSYAGTAASIGYGVRAFAKLAIGDGTFNFDGARRHMTMAAEPGSGTWARGDVVYNRDPSAGGKLGWVCVTGGAPGTWKAFGSIDP
jgi:hypothetical protein